ncbi:MAG: TMEM43 family protein [Deltaproteobacteria bacterium]|jgi:hypothetical protein|nr:TMEM43 family protein [Deltaproteobacteria bacterium]
MAYTETTSVSWLDRLGSSFRGILIGVVLLIAGNTLLWWNEGNFVGTGDALREAHSVTQELGDIHKLDNSKNGMLVHAVGPVATKDMLSDPVFGVSRNAIRLERMVEFYQWLEESTSEKRKKLGGSEETVTTYRYAAKWTSRPVDSSQFKDPGARTEHRNIVLAAMENFKTQAVNVTFGAYRLPAFLIHDIGDAASLDVALSEAMKTRLNRQLALAVQSADPAMSAAREEASLVHVSGNTVLLSASPGMPRIGDVRITFKETRPGTVSILAKLNGDTFEQYHAGNGKTVGILSMGTHSLENMYADAQAANAVMTWILRVVGALLVIFGIRLIAAPLEVLAGVIPLLGSVIGAGTGIVSIVLGLAVSFCVISIAWLRFRPLVGGVMLGVAGVLVALLYVKGRPRKAANAQAPAAEAKSA